MGLKLNGDSLQPESFKIIYSETNNQLAMASIYGALTFTLIVIVALSAFKGINLVFSDNFIPVWLILFFLSLLFVYTSLSKISLAISDDEIHLKASPIQRSFRRFQIKQIKNIELISHNSFINPLLQFKKPYIFNELGYQVIGDVESYTYTVIGGNGLLISFHNGRKLFIGSYHPEKIYKALTK